MVSRVRTVRIVSARVYYILLPLLLAPGACTWADAPPTAPPDAASPVTALMTKGAADAPVTIVEYSDYQ